MDVATWLEAMDLGQYAQAFADNGVDAEVLPYLTPEDLKEIGVRAVGHRRKLIEAIAALRDQDEAAGAPATVADDPISPQAAMWLPGAERRQLTLMFCDLVGSTALSARLDPEDLREIIGAYHRCVAETVTRFGGFVAKYMGDGVLVYFGYPQAHEDDAERAVRAALATLQAVGQVAPAGEQLAARIGLATGLVVVGDLLGAGAAQELAVVGGTPNLAARLQALADPGSTVIDAETRRRIGGLFECRDVGAVSLKGLSGSVRTWQVLGEAVVDSRFEAMHPVALASLVGREDELQLLLHRWRQAKDGEGQVVLLSGEPGIGKSRLIAAFEEQVSGEDHVKFKYFCSPHHRDSPLQPISVRWENELGFLRGEPADARLDKLEALLLPLGATPEEVTLLAEMLGVPGGERYPSLDLSPQRKKEQTYKALIRIFVIRARQRPILMLFEDAHWADPSSLELFDRVIARLAFLPVLLILSYRSEFQPPWVGHAGVSLIALSRLSRRQAATLASQVVTGQTLPAAMLERIVAQTDGVPLFIEELTKAVLEQAGPANAAGLSLPVPSTLQASLMARLDRLPAAKQVAQIGAVIGREFGHELLTAVAGLPELTLTRGLDELVDAGLVFRHGALPEARYVFKHALVQEAAHESLLKARRQQLHAHVVQALEDHFPEMVDAEPELLAQHCTEAGLAEQAVDYWQRAGQQALARSAMAEAVAQLTRGLGVLRGLPEGPKRQRRELGLQLALGRASLAAMGFAAPETGRAYARAYELCCELGENSELLPVLYGRWVFHFMRSELVKADEVARELLRLAKERTDASGRVTGHRVVGATLFQLGRFIESRDHCEAALALYDPVRDRASSLIYAIDSRVVSLSWLSHLLVLVGRPGAALARDSEEAAYARELAHPYTEALAFAWGCIFRQLLRDRQKAFERAEALIALATKQGFPLYRAAGMVVRGWALAQSERVEDGITEMRQGLAAYGATGAEMWSPYFLGLLAEAEGRAGRPAIGLSLVVDALERADRTGARWFEAELHRLRGELLLVLSEPARSEADACFRRALAIASEQGAKMWQLRAATSLARLWSDQDRRDEARDLLAPIHAWFTEGFDAPDLKDARALLDELRE
ncbi:AAA family ATPase [Microvirga massiliensis]|uniref:AAA family ATPase n=1 Tax=Microvirga massiliensis TaxID=1033741 RepID=UPI00062B3858|nr:adenylate/guanylate cyclase domain-containing protein [Microvirga massiliensis]